MSGLSTRRAIASDNAIAHTITTLLIFVVPPGNASVMPAKKKQPLATIGSEYEIKCSSPRSRLRPSPIIAPKSKPVSRPEPPNATAIPESKQSAPIIINVVRASSSRESRKIPYAPSETTITAPHSIASATMPPYGAKITAPVKS